MNRREQMTRHLVRHIHKQRTDGEISPTNANVQIGNLRDMDEPTMADLCKEYGLEVPQVQVPGSPYDMRKDHANLGESLKIDIEVKGPSPTDILIMVVDPETGYKSRLEGVRALNFEATVDNLNELVITVINVNFHLEMAKRRVVFKAATE